MPKIIVLLADGTGNSAAKLFKTNVWRLYRALDLAETPQADETRQIAYYHDGVGTSSFKPLALLGGIFGVGLKRNVIEIYRFLCRNYAPGDRIYAFGFSRGAFTIRVLAGLIASENVLCCATDEELKRYSADAYRRYRRAYKLPLWGKNDKTTTDPNAREKRVGLVDRLRDARDWVIRWWRDRRKQRQYESVDKYEVERIDFLGVWDTVAAYGLPVDEMTRGIDQWVWPLSMPNYVLSPKVKRARHALALDDERNTFHPLLWDELGEPDVPFAERRLQQVWFAGMHSNVGGGYADDSLSLVPLRWMMEESAAPIDGSPGLRFLPEDRREANGTENPFGRIYDSRRGLAAYYRYQPRRISARLDPPDPATRLSQDPELYGKGLLRSAFVHLSVLDRVRAGHDRYAPIVLPPAYAVVNPDRTTEPGPTLAQPERREWVWNDVWRRRVNYFFTVIVSFVLLFFPAFVTTDPPPPCSGPQCMLTPVIMAAGSVLPGFLGKWIAAFAAAPGLFLLTVLAFSIMMARSKLLSLRIDDGMRELWLQAFGMPIAPNGAVTQAGRSAAPPRDWVFRLRTHPVYQNAFHALKWNVLPGAFGAVALYGGLLLALLILLVAAQRVAHMGAEHSNRWCPVGGSAAAATGQASRFDTRALCAPTGVRIEHGKTYRITMTLVDPAAAAPASNAAIPWRDKTIPASPAGFESDRLSFYLRPFVLLRRSISGRWFQPILKIVPADGRGGPTRLLEFVHASGGRPVFETEFKAAADGTAFLFVNDVVMLPWGFTRRFYDNNRGEADVRITEVVIPRR